jgi:hypothetical protein
MIDPETYLHNRFPETDTLIKSVNELINLDLNKISVWELRLIINNRFPIISLNELFWNTQHYIFRVRRNLNNDFEPYKNLCEIGLPPLDSTPFGRANNEFEPIFYGAHDGNLALFESCQNIPESSRFEPQNFTMGIWKIKNNETLRIAPILENQSVKNIRLDIKQACDLKENKISSRIKSQKVIQGTKIISMFFADQFAKSLINSPNDYKFSSFYANTIREFNKTSDVKFDGILYPSVAYKFKGDNVAIFPMSLHKLELVKCFSIISYNFNFESGTLVSGITAEGKVESDGDIKWTNKL